MAKIILSYRRSDTRAVAGRIHDKLVARYGKGAVFIDVDSIPFGTDFRQHINDALNVGDIVVAIVGRQWLGLAGGAAEARIFEETDPVRVEIETALQRGIVVVPVLVDGATMPKPNQLPVPIKGFSFLNAAEVDDGRDFHQHMERVIRSLDANLRGAARRRGSGWRSKRSLRWAGGIAAVLAVLSVASVYRAQILAQFNRATQTAPVSETSNSVRASVAPSTPASRPEPKAPNQERRVALVIGNSNYRYAPRLATPSNDANLLGDLLKKAEFDVVSVRRDVGNLELKRALREFEDATLNADIAIVFYAGYETVLGDGEFLMPVDAVLARDLDIADETVSLERVLVAVGGAKRLRLVILDTCYDNPLDRSMKRSLTRSPAKVQPATADTLVAFACKPGTTAPAQDSGRMQSYFTEALLQTIAVPGLDVRLAFGRIHDQVLKATQNRQEPFVYGSLGGATFTLVPAPSGLPGSSSPDEVKGDYDMVARIGTKTAWEVFLTTHKTGFYSDLARAQLEKLKKESP